ncbi:MAG: class I SAM-dependent methyltransferase [Bradyrhizobium sp.]
MGRFATAAALYEKFRPPYPPDFFREVARRVSLSKQGALIDLGTGPGLLALGFASYVGRVTGVDPEPAMLAAAKAAAARAKVTFTLIEGRAEDLPDDIGGFDLVTIGRALHWMERNALGPLLEQLVAPGGSVAVCASFSATDGRNAWLEAYRAARHDWSDARLWSESRHGERRHRDFVDALAVTSFRGAEVITVESTQQIGVGDLAQRMLTFSASSPAALGDRAQAMLRDVEARLIPFSHDGILAEIVVSTAKIARR